jgi:hypothetical protein
LNGGSRPLHYIKDIEAVRESLNQGSITGFYPFAKFAAQKSLCYLEHFGLLDDFLGSTQLFNRLVELAVVTGQLLKARYVICGC